MNPEIKQHFIQTCALRGCLRVVDAVDALKPICEKYDAETPEDSAFKEFIATLNTELNEYDHDIAFVKYPLNKEEYIVFRTVNSKVIRFLNHLTEQDRNYFRVLLMTVAVAENYGIPEFDALNLTSTLPKEKPLSKSRAQGLLTTWKEVGYFMESDGTLYLGPKMIVEFESYLLSCFSETVKECSLCKKIVLWDPSCNECETKFHSECIRRYLIKASNCPACQKLWSTSFV